MKENNNEKNNSNAIITVLSVLLICVTSFTIYYVITNENNRKLEKTNENTEKKDDEPINPSTNTEEQQTLIDDKQYFVTLQNCITYIIDSNDNKVSDDKYAIVDVDNDGYEDIIYYRSIDSISWKYVLFKGSKKGYYVLYKSDSDRLHKSHSRIIKEEGKNYLTYIFAHMGYEMITNIYFTDNGLDKKIILDTEYKGDDIKYKSEDLIDILNWVKVK